MRDTHASLPPPRARTFCSRAGWKEVLRRTDHAGMMELERAVDLPGWDGSVVDPLADCPRANERGKHVGRSSATGATFGSGVRGSALVPASARRWAAAQLPPVDGRELARRVAYPRPHWASDLGAGAFPVPKSASVDRFVSSRTPANSQEWSLGASRELLPNACCYAELQLGRHEGVRGSVDDLPDFYRTELCSRDRAQSNQIGHKFEWHELSDFPAAAHFREREGDSFHPSHLVRAVQRTVPMGDLNATDFSQIAHMGVLRAGGACRPDEYLTYRGPVPRGRTWETLQVDDHIVTQVCPTRALGKPPGSTDRDRVLLGDAERAYDSAGLAPRPDKRKRYESVFEVIGGCVDGLAGRVSAKPAFLLLTSLIATVVGMSADCTGLLMQTALAMFVYNFLFARELLSLFGHAYQFAGKRGADSLACRPLGGAARDEVLAAAILLPLASTNIRAPVHSTVFASDARGGSQPRAGVVTTRVPEAVAAELWRHRNRRAGYVSPRNGPPRIGLAGEVDRVLSTSKEALLSLMWDEQEDDDFPDPDGQLWPPGNWRPRDVRDAHELGAQPRPHPQRTNQGWFVPECAKQREHAAHAQRQWVDKIADAASWTTVTRNRAVPHEAIHLSEMRGARLAARSMLARGTRDARVLVLVDSTVCVGALAKGRSSSQELNWLMRTFRFELLFAGIQLGVLHVSSAANPADPPSRGEDTRVGPAAEVEDWARRFLDGEIEAVDPHLPPAHWERLVLPLYAAPLAEPRDFWHLSTDDYAETRPSERALARCRSALHERLRGAPLSARVVRERTRDLLR